MWMHNLSYSITRNEQGRKEPSESSRSTKLDRRIGNSILPPIEDSAENYDDETTMLGPCLVGLDWHGLKHDTGRCAPGEGYRRASVSYKFDRLPPSGPLK